MTSYLQMAYTNHCRTPRAWLGSFFSMLQRVLTYVRVFGIYEATPWSMFGYCILFWSSSLSCPGLICGYHGLHYLLLFLILVNFYISGKKCISMCFAWPLIFLLLLLLKKTIFLNLIYLLFFQWSACGRCDKGDITYFVLWYDYTDSFLLQFVRYGKTCLRFTGVSTSKFAYPPPSFDFPSRVGIPFRTGILTWGFQLHKKYLNLD
jgi:hypothetical protein